METSSPKKENCINSSVTLPEITEEDDGVMELVNQMKEKIQKTIKSENSFFDKRLIKELVSKKKNRFEHEGFNLDLSYITTNIIAMGFPADSFEKLYRNSREEVVRFLHQRHDKHYKVYNLCEEKSYPENTFDKQAVYPYKDHEAPPIKFLFKFCEDVLDFLSSDSRNIVAVHCKAGKGRTGTMICCYLLYTGFVRTAEEALKFYGHMRTKNGKGVTIPSQIRYVYYFEHLLKLDSPWTVCPPSVFITKVKMFTVPRFAMNGKCTPYFKLENNNYEFNYKSVNKLQTFKNEAVIEFKLDKISVNGDVNLMFFNKNTIGKDKMFSLWFNTFFAPKDGIMMFKKSMLDKACKDKENVLYDYNFKIEIHYIISDNEVSEMFSELKI